MENILSWQMLNKDLMLSVFSPSMTQAIRSSEFPPEETSFWVVVLSFARDFTEVRLTSTFPTDINNFFTVLGPILSIELKDLFRDRLRSFDEIAGWEVSEGFACSFSFQYWLRYLAGLLMRSSKAQKARQEASKRCCGTLLSAGRSILSRITDSVAQSIKSYNATSDESEKTTRGKIIQITLSGRTILDAWASNSTVAMLEGQSPDRTHIPTSEPVEYTVYHGTTAHLDHWMWPEKWNADKLNLTGSPSTDQMTPLGIDSVYTTFSPLRAFLWAAFVEYMRRDVPTDDEAGWSETTWTSAGHSFAGVVVFAFDVPQSASRPLSYAVVPEGKEGEWRDRLMEVAEGQNWHDQRDEAWRFMSPVHGSATASWPDVLHAREVGGLEELAPYRANPWSTCWSGRGVEVLNQGYVNTMAITFVKTPTVSEKSSV